MYLSGVGIISLVTVFIAAAVVFGLIGFFIGLEQAEVVYEQVCRVDRFFANIGYLVVGVAIVVAAGGIFYLFTKNRRW